MSEAVAAISGAKKPDDNGVNGVWNELLDQIIAKLSQ